MSQKIFIVAAKRTAIGSFQGTLANHSAVTLGVETAKSALAQSGVRAEDVDEVIVGNVLSAGLGMGVGRQVAIGAGLPHDVPAYTLNMICGSGMKAVLDACAHIKAGDAEVVLTVGTESMSNAAFALPGKTRRGHKMGNLQLADTILSDGLTDAFNQYHMGITAENIAQVYNISRNEQDEFALQSQQKAQQAIESGCFEEEIVALDVVRGREHGIFDQDEHVRANTSLDKLATLSPAFKDDGTVTAGNSSGLNDGASAIILVSEDALKRFGLTPLAEVISTGQGGVDPAMMGMGPIPAIAQALERSAYHFADIERIELNEAFAAQSLGVLYELSSQHEYDAGLLMDKTNPTGGAIALGHPIGCSGNRIITTLIYGLRRDGQQLGLASLCIGGGMGTALLVKAC
ncbi:acetyl-CoA C-acetyltransferase [Suttonella sp. R2A3]|uniref:acetyl-CoA C-acetyltransferase n=1 Tax=Suttonella sp. R2A3 TaxID=2908648 RepID=UPI001F231309|nr:acetyl-CoA C-acetyltransferase [Suttonella sp. R2A3]UJF24581.1 acetyl-CoA C-acetyltransferase [Suttonella sp. R2A3]